MNNGIVETFKPSAELSKLTIQPNEIIVIKIDTNKYTLDEAEEIYQQIINDIPEEYQNNIIGIPSGIEMETADIDYLIQRLEYVKNECLH